MGMGSKKKNEAAAASGSEVAGSTEPASTTPAAPPAQEDGDVTLQPVSDPAPETDGEVVDQLHEQDQDAADAAGIGSAHGDQPTDPAIDAAPDVVDEVRTLDVQILSIAEPAGEVLDEIQTEQLKLELRLDELGDPIARRNTIATVIAEETANWKAAERQHRDRMGALRQSLNEEFERGQEQLEEIRLANIRLNELKVLAEQKAAAIAEAARLAATAPAPIAGDSA